MTLVLLLLIILLHHLLLLFLILILLVQHYNPGWVLAFPTSLFHSFLWNDTASHVYFGIYD